MALWRLPLAAVQLPLPDGASEGYDPLPHRSFARRARMFVASFWRKESPVAKQSSVAVVCRAVVMLACLVSIPLVAVSGGSLPKPLESVLADYWPSAFSQDGDSPDEPPLFHPTEMASIAPIPHAPTGRSGGAEESAPRFAGHSNMLDTPPAVSADVVPVGFESPAPAASAAEPAGLRSTTAPQLNPVSQPPDGRDSGVELRQAAPAEQSPKTPAPSDPFSAMQSRLQQLGATYVLLESMGNRQEVYRCYCRIAVGGDPSYAYYFEAVESAPLGAMAQVVRQVEQWRAGRP